MTAAAMEAAAAAAVTKMKKSFRQWHIRVATAQSSALATKHSRVVHGILFVRTYVLWTGHSIYFLSHAMYSEYAWACECLL